MSELHPEVGTKDMEGKAETPALVLHQSRKRADLRARRAGSSSATRRLRHLVQVISSLGA